MNIRVSHIRFLAVAALLLTMLLSVPAQAQIALSVEKQVSASSDDAYHTPGAWPGYGDTQTIVLAGARGANGAQFGGWRWTGLGVPDGATILDAYVLLNQAGWDYTITTTLALEDSAIPATFSPQSSPYHRWSSRTDFEVDWTWPKNVPTTWIQTPSLAAGVQELVDRHGAVDNIVLLEDGTGVLQRQYHQWAAFDGDPDRAATLYIEFSADPDDAPPLRTNGAPTGELAPGTSEATLSLRTDEGATCRFSSFAEVPFDAMTHHFAETGGRAHGTPITITEGESTYYVRCEDIFGNANTTDYVISFVVSTLPGGELTTIVLDIQVSASADDAYHTPQGWPSYSETSDSVYAGARGANGPQWGGWRWEDLYIPGDAIVTEAYVQLNQRGWGDVFPTTLALQDDPQPASFSPTSSPFTRWSTRTDFEIDWTWPKQTSGSWIQTPSLVEGIQEMLERHGGIEDLVMLEDGSPAPQTEYHGWATYDRDPARAAKLHIEFIVAPIVMPPLEVRVAASADDAYHTPGTWPGYSDTSSSVYAGARGAGGAQWGGWRWDGLTLPAGTVITDAYVSLNQRAWGDVIPTTLSLQNVPQPESFSPTSSPYTRWANRTDFEIGWTWPKQSSGNWIQTPPITQGVQELIDRHDGIDGLVLLEDGSRAPQTDYHEWASYDRDPERAASLHLEYTVPHPRTLNADGTSIIIEPPAPPADTAPPTRLEGQPTGILITGTTHATLSLRTDEAATCRYGIVGSTLYDAMPHTFATTGDTEHQQTVSGLADGGAYTYLVRCRDASGNTNEDDYAISFDIAVASDEDSPTATPTATPTPTTTPPESGDGFTNAQSRLVFTQQPTDTVAGGTLPLVEVTVQDADGNTITDAAMPIMVGLGVNRDGATLFGTTTVTPIDGVAHFTDLSIDNPHADYTLVAYTPLDLLAHWDGHTYRYADVWAEGNYAYLGTPYESKGVSVFDISDPANPTLAYVWEPDTGSAEVIDIKISDGIAVFGSVFRGAFIVDVNDPLNPVQLARIRAAEGGFDEVHNTSIHGDYLFISDNIAPDVKVFDISSPAAPVFITTLTSPSGGKVHGVVAKNGRLYSSIQNFPGFTDIWDISNLPSAPLLISAFSSGDVTHSSWPTEDGNFLAIAHEKWRGDLEIWDISDPANPFIASTLDPVALGFGTLSVHDPVIVGNILYASWANGVQVFEISDPTNPVPIGSYVTDAAPSGSTNTGAWGVFPLMGQDKVLVSDWHNGLFVLDNTPMATRSEEFDIYPSEPGLLAAFAPPARSSSDGLTTLGGAPETQIVSAPLASTDSGFTHGAARVWSGIASVLEQGAPALALSMVLAIMLALLTLPAREARRGGPRFRYA